MKIKHLFIVLAAVSLTACTKSDSTPELQPYALDVPAGFPEWTAMPDNPLSVQGIELGRKLFYDKRLSGNNLISCGSCHRQSLAFSDGVAKSSIGVSGNMLHRNSPALINLAWAGQGLFWDGGSTNLESQAFAPISSPDEMHQDFFRLTEELRQDPEYLRQFLLVFGDRELKIANVVKAIAQFERTLISSNSKYDQYRRGENGVQLGWQELQGLQLFQQRCSGCHSGELFTDNSFHNNGIDSDFTDESHERIGMGRFRITLDPTDLGKFKTPTLRNIALTGPYMHDGRFASLAEVVEHYSGQIKISPTLDSSLQTAAAGGGMALSNEQKTALLAFLNSLTDNRFVQDKNLSDPFN